MPGSGSLVQTQNPAATPPPAKRFNDRDLVKEFMDDPAPPKTEIKTVPAGLPPLEIDDAAPDKAKPVAAATTTPRGEESSVTEATAPPETESQSTQPVAAVPSSEPARAEAGAPPEGVVAAPGVAPASAAAAKVYDPAEAVVLSEDGKNSWTKEQIVTALRERVNLQQTVEETTQAVARLRGMFGDDAVVDKLWKPLIERVREHPEQGAFLGHFIDCDDDKRQWLLEASASYDEQMGIPPPAPRAELPPEVRAELSQVRGYIQQQEQQRAIDRFNREMAAVTAAYPFVATNAGVRQYLAGRAQQLYAQDLARGVKPDEARALIAAMEEERSSLEALKAAQGLPLAAPAAAAPALASVPAGAAVLGSTGAAPTTSRDRSVPKPKPGEKIDPVANWLAFSEGKTFKPKE